MSEVRRAWEKRPVQMSTHREMFLRARELFYGARDEEYVDWLYSRNPAGPAYCTLAVDGDVIAGQYVIIPIRMAVFGQSVKACLSLDTFTHENYRKQGIFAALAEETYLTAERDGARFTVGLPNESSYPGFVGRLRFTEPVDLRAAVRVLPLRTILASRAAGVATALFRGGGLFHHRLSFGTPASLDAAWGDALWKQLLPHTRWGLWKDGAWLRWRFCDNPRDTYHFITAERDGAPAGYLVWREDPHARYGARGVWLVDIEGTTAGVRLGLLARLAAEVSGHADYVKARFVPGSASGLVQLAAGFVPYRKIPFIFRPHGEALPGAPSMRSADWMISAAFTDTL